MEYSISPNSERVKSMMIKLLLFTLLIYSSLSVASITITMKGKWSPTCNGVVISEHKQFTKAVEAVINQNVECDIIPPDRFEIRHEVVEPKSIKLTWDLPTEYEDGRALTIIDRFNLYQTFNDGGQMLIEVQASSTEYVLANVSRGVYTFKISTVSEGLEGKPSKAISVTVD